LVRRSAIFRRPEALIAGCIRSRKRVRRELSRAHTRYSKFNGGSSNYDGVGRAAGDNDALYFLLWFAY